MRTIAQESGDFTAYDVKAPAAAKTKGGKASAVTSRYYLLVYRPRTGGVAGRSVVAVAKESGGRIIGYRIYEEK